MDATYDLTIASPPDQVLRALLDPQALAAWWGCTAIVEVRAGGLWAGGWGQGADGLGHEAVLQATIADYQPGQRLSLQVGTSTITFACGAHPHGCSLQLGLQGFADEGGQAAMQTWLDSMANLQAWAEQQHPAPREPALVEAAPLDAPPLDAAPEEAVPLDAPPLAAVPEEAVPLDAPPLEAAPVDAVPLEATPLASAPVDAVQPESAPRQAAQSPAPAQPSAAPRGVDPFAGLGLAKVGEVKVVDEGGFGVTDPHAVIKSWVKEQGFGYVTHSQLGEISFDYNGCDFEPAVGDQVLLLVIGKRYDGKPKIKRIACPAKGSNIA